MKVILPPAPGQYDPRIAQSTNYEIAQAFGRVRAVGEDVEIDAARLILTSPNGTRFSVTVANDGTLSATSL